MKRHSDGSAARHVSIAHYHLESALREVRSALRADPEHRLARTVAAIGGQLDVVIGMLAQEAGA